MSENIEEIFTDNEPKRGYADALEWISSNFEVQDYSSYTEYIEDIRNEFSNDNLIDSIEEEIVLNFEESRIN